MRFTLAAWLVASALAAHDFWIEPSTFHPEPGATVTVGLRVGQDFVGDAVPRNGALIERFVVRQAGGEDPILGNEGSDPAGWLHADGRATAVLIFRSRPSRLELPATKFEDYLRAEGLERIVAIRAKRGASAEPGREIFSRCAKALLRGAEASAAVRDPVGLRFEIVPDEDPTQPCASPFRAHLLYRDQPLAGARVVAIPRSDPDTRVEQRSDSHGAVSLTLPCGGVWLIKSVHMVEASPFALSGADWESLWASLTFEVPEGRVNPESSPLRDPR